MILKGLIGRSLNVALAVSWYHINGNLTLTLGYYLTNKFIFCSKHVKPLCLTNIMLRFGLGNGKRIQLQPRNDSEKGEIFKWQEGS